MPVTVNAAAALNGAGAFATSRRGAVGYEEIAHARSVLGDRATAAQVAKMIGRCEADVRPLLGCKSEIEVACVLVAMKPPVDDKEVQSRQAQADQAFADKWDRGVRTLDLAERFSKSPHGIRAWAARLGLKPRKIKFDKVIWTEALDEVVRRDFVSGRKPAAEVAKTIPGATKAAVIARAFRKGWCTPKARKIAA